MPYCPKCGAQNDEEAKFCVKCGTMLHVEKAKERHEECCFGSEQHEEDVCFGIRQGGAILGMLFGVFIVIVGLVMFLGRSFPHMFGPFALVAIGVLVVVVAVFGLSQLHRD